MARHYLPLSSSCAGMNTVLLVILHCNTLQHTATHCNTLQHTASHCNTLQHTATHCNTSQHTATLQHTSVKCKYGASLLAVVKLMRRHQTCFIVDFTLQHTLQHIATNLHTHERRKYGTYLLAFVDVLWHSHRRHIRVRLSNTRRALECKNRDFFCANIELSAGM